MIDISLKTTLTGHQNQIFALTNIGNDLLFSGGNDKGVVEWDLNTLTFKRILCAVPSPVYNITYLQDSDNLAIGLRSSEVMIVDYQNQSLVSKLAVGKGAVFAILLLERKSEIIVVGEEGVAYVFSSKTFEQLYRFRVADSTVRTIAATPDEKYVYFGAKDGTIYQYEASDYHPTHRVLLHKMPVTSLLVLDDFLFTGGRDAKMYKLNANDLGLIQEITPHLFTVYGIVKHPEQNIIATASRDKTWKIWDPNDLRLLKNVSRDRGFESHHLSINIVLWTKKYLFTAGDDKMIKIWNVAVS